MTAYFERVKSSFESGTLQAGGEPELRTTCPFRLYGFVRPVSQSQAAVDEVEKEQKEPSGIPVPVVAPLVIDAVLVSQECGLLIELEELQGERTDRWYRRAMNCGFLYFTID
jgi:transmembrane E3 ubiquitin-protein ligase